MTVNTKVTIATTSTARAMPAIFTARFMPLTVAARPQPHDGLVGGLRNSAMRSEWRDKKTRRSVCARPRAHSTQGSGTNSFAEVLSEGDRRLSHHLTKRAVEARLRREPELEADLLHGLRSARQRVWW